MSRTGNLAGLRLRLGERLARSPVNILLIVCLEILPRFVNKSSASSVEKKGGSDASLRIESRRFRMDGDNNAEDSRSRPLGFAKDRVSGSEGVGATDTSLNSLSWS
jgi:hypothetical protein